MCCLSVVFFLSLDYSNLIVRALQATCDDVANTSKT